jgi:mannose-6-phosphate isomerase class I
MGVPWAYGAHRILESEYFQLDRYDCAAEPLVLNTRGESFYLVTSIDGAVAVITANGQATLGRYETLLVPASTGEFRLTAGSKAQVLVSHVPTTGISR